VLRPAQAALFEFCYELSYEPQPVDIVACRYLFHNLKTALKAKLAGADDTAIYSPISVRDISAEALREAVLGEGTLPDYLMSAAQAAAELYGRTGNPQSIDIVVDKAQLARQLALAEALGSQLIEDYIRRSIDYYNLIATLRAKSMGHPAGVLATALCPGGGESVEYFLNQFTKGYSAMAAAFYYRPFGKVAQRGIEAFERTGSFAVLERLMDNDLLDQARLAKRVAFGPEVIFGYLVAKENELRQIRMVMAAKINELSPERLRERLRENYV
jgi:V/A-type H+-transporting ATPase subunit C